MFTGAWARCGACSCAGSWLISLRRTGPGGLAQLHRQQPEPGTACSVGRGNSWCSMARCGTAQHAVPRHSATRASCTPGIHGRPRAAGTVWQSPPWRVADVAVAGIGDTRSTILATTCAHSPLELPGALAPQPLPRAAHTGTKCASHWICKKWKSSGCISEHHALTKPQFVSATSAAPGVALSSAPLLALEESLGFRSWWPLSPPSAARERDSWGND